MGGWGGGGCDEHSNRNDRRSAVTVSWCGEVMGRSDETSMDRMKGIRGGEAQAMDGCV